MPDKKKKKENALKKFSVLYDHLEQTGHTGDVLITLSFNCGGLRNSDLTWSFQNYFNLSMEEKVQNNK